MSKKLLISLLIIIVFVFGLFLITKSKPKIEPTTIPDNEQTLLGPTVEEVAKKVASIISEVGGSAWKNYESKELAIKFKYPPNIFVINKNNLINIYFDTKDTRSYLDPRPSFEGKALEAPLTMGIAKVKTGAILTDLKEECEKYGAVCNISTFLGRQAEVSVWEALDMGDNIYFLNGSDLYVVSMTYGLPNDDVRATYYKILSTVEFLK